MVVTLRACVDLVPYVAKATSNVVRVHVMLAIAL